MLQLYARLFSERNVNTPQALQTHKCRVLSFQLYLNGVISGRFWLFPSQTSRLHSTELEGNFPECFQFYSSLPWNWLLYIPSAISAAASVYSTTPTMGNQQLSEYEGHNCCNQMQLRLPFNLNIIGVGGLLNSSFLSQLTIVKPTKHYELVSGIFSVLSLFRFEAWSLYFFTIL